MLKKIVTSKTLRFCFSVVMIYFAFRKVDVLSLFKQLAGMKIWFLVANILITFSLVSLISYRWSLLIIKKPRWKDIWVFTKSSFAASFYGLFFPTAAAGDVLKWIIIDEKYPEIPKSKLLGSVLLDRFIGLSMFVLTGVIMLLVGRLNGVTISWIIELVFWGLFFGCLIFYIAFSSFHFLSVCHNQDYGARINIMI